MLSCCKDFKSIIERNGMVRQTHKRLTEEQVKTILDRYMRKELGAVQAMRGSLSPFPYYVDSHSIFRFIVEIGTVFGRSII